jgi:DNA replication protein DnaC
MQVFSNEPDESGMSARGQMAIYLERCKEFVDNFGTGKEPRNLLFYGQVGSGKTFLCSCIAKAILDKQHVVIYNMAPVLFEMLNNLRFRRNLEKIPESFQSDLETCDLLIIDDIGSEFSSNTSQSDLLSIINTRIMTDKQTVLSSNLSMEDIKVGYTDRLVSRLFGYYTRLQFIGVDLRIRKYADEAKKAATRSESSKRQQ